MNNKNVNVVSAVFGSLFLLSCTPTVRLDTPEPVRIDVNMKVEVTTKNVNGSGATKFENADQDASPRLRQRNRITEVQSLKNDRLVGENKVGQLEVKKLPTDPAYQEYTKKIIDAENSDRRQIYQIEADAQNKPLSFIQTEYARRLRESAFPGEWIEQDNGVWSQR
jgi:uncharacterized protein